MRYTEQELSLTGGGVTTGFYRVRTDLRKESCTYFQDREGNYRAVDASFLAIQKLADAENKEEEIGVDLNLVTSAVLAVKNGAYVRPWEKIKHTPFMSIERTEDGKLVLLDNYDNDYKLEDYGQTWALDKEILISHVGSKLWNDYSEYTVKFRDICAANPGVDWRTIPAAVEAQEAAQNFKINAKKAGFELVKEDGYWKFKYTED